MGLFGDIFGGGSPKIDYPVLARMNNASQSTVGALTGLITGAGSDAYETNPWGIFSNNKDAQKLFGSKSGGGGGWNMLDILQNQQTRDMPTINKMIDFNGETFNTGNRLLDALNSKVNGDSNAIIGQASALRKSLMGTVGGGYDAAINAATGNLTKTLKNINAGVGAQAVASGVNSGNTIRRSRTQQGNEAQRIAEIVGQLGVQKSGALGAADASSGAMLMNALSGRSSANEGAAQSILGQRMSLRDQNINSTLGLDAQRRAFEMDPIGKLISSTQAIPTWGASPVISQNPGWLNTLADTTKNVMSAVASVYTMGASTGLFGGNKGQQGMQALGGQIGEMLGGYSYHDPNAAGPLGPGQFSNMYELNQLLNGGFTGRGRN